MKQVLAVISVILILLVLFMSGCGSNAQSGQAPAKAASSDSDSVTMTKIKLTFDGGEATAELADNPTSRSLIAQLPLTISFKDFNETEKIAYTPEKLSQEDAPDGMEPKAGDVAVFGPWGNVSIFYKPFRYSERLIPMGHITSGLDALAKKQGDFDVTIEAVSGR